MYHGCGNANSYLEDMIEIGLDAYNPLEAKADLDVVELRKRLGHRLTFAGNSDIRVWERGDPEEVEREVIHRLRAAEGGGYIFMSDHSVASDVAGRTYDDIVKLVRRYGTYPLDLPAE
jgi:uroporphyrinogen-III decarboxylase